MLKPSSSSRQPVRVPWTAARFREERARALGFSLDRSTRSTYHSHLQSFLTFCDLHGFSYEPTEETLCNFIVYMSHHIQPRSVSTYLSGICNQLEHLFPDVRATRKRPVVTKTLQGCLRQLGTPPSRKLPLSVDHLARFSLAFPSPSHDDLLFLALSCCGFFALHRLGELVDNDDPRRRSARKRILRHTASVSPSDVRYSLPSHKADRFFEGNLVIIPCLPSLAIDPVAVFARYLASRDASSAGYFPYLWLTAQHDVPTRSWFLSRFHRFLPPSFGGHSLRSGGATFFASQGWPNDRIQALGRWASDAFQLYIRKHPVLLQALSSAPPSLPPS
jgi:hypothetical protein